MPDYILIPLRCKAGMFDHSALPLSKRGGKHVPLDSLCNVELFLPASPPCQEDEVHDEMLVAETLCLGMYSTSPG